MRNRSISERLRRVSTFEGQEEVLKEWREGWRKDQLLTIIRLRRAAEDDDHSEIMHMIDQLQGITEKRFTGLEGALRILSNPDRRLKHQEEAAPVDITDAAEISPTTDQVTISEEKANPSEGFDIAEIVKCYNAQMPIKEISERNDISTHKVIKILVTAGVYTSETYDAVQAFRERGLTDTDIALRLDLSKSAMNDYTPYKKGFYNLDVPSDNAKKLREWRDSRKNKVTKKKSQL